MPEIESHTPAGQAYITIGAIRNTEATLRWSGAQLVFTLNPSVAGGLFYAFLKTNEPLQMFLIFAAVVCACMLNIAWRGILVRDGQYIRFWNKKLAELERKNPIEGDVQIFTDPEYVRLASARERLQVKLERIARSIINIWIWAAVIVYINLLYLSWNHAYGAPIVIPLIAIVAILGNNARRRVYVYFLLVYKNFRKYLTKRNLQ